MMYDIAHAFVIAVDIVLLISMVAYLIGDDLKTKEARNVSLIVSVIFAMNLILLLTGG